MDLDEEEQSLVEAIESNIDYFLTLLRTATPAEVVKSDGLRATATPLINKMIKKSEGKYLSQQPIDNCIVMHCGGTDVARVTTPVKKGTKGLLIFAERDISLWSKGDGKAANAGTSRKHDINDAIFIAGLLPFTATKPSTEDLVIEMNYDKPEKRSSVTLKANGDIVMDTPTEIHLGKDATESILKGDLFKQHFLAHTHPTGVGPSGTPIQPWTPDLLSEVSKTI